MRKYEIFICKPIAVRAVEFYIQYRDTDEHATYISEPIVFHKIKHPYSEREPATLALEPEESQFFLRSMLEQLKSNGLELNLEIEGELKATKIHLNDMRSLVFKNKGITTNEIK